MIYDGITLRETYDSICLDHLEPYSNYPNGNTTYLLKNERDLKVTTTNFNQLTISGSLPHYWQGHSYKFSEDDFFNCLQSVEEAIQVDLSNANVSNLEFGAIMETGKEICFDLIKNTHHKPKGFKPKAYYEYGIEFKSSKTLIKLYDYDKRLKHFANNKRKDLISNLEYDPNTHNYFKLEGVHERIKNLTVSQLFESGTFRWFEDCLRGYYDLLDKSPCFQYSGSKKPHIPHIYLAYIIENCQGFTPSDLKVFIDRFPSLGREDTKQRKRVLRDQLKLVESDTIKLDLSPYLETALIR